MLAGVHEALVEGALYRHENGTDGYGKIYYQ